MTAQLRNLEEQAQSLANYLPGGRLFKQANIRDSNFRKLLRGLAEELIRSDDFIRVYQEEIIPDETVSFIDEWEAAVGIPDACFSGVGTVAERRFHVLIKLASLGVQTAEDLVELGALFGITLDVRSGSVNGNFPFVFPWRFYNSAIEARFTIVVSFTVTEANRFPFTFPIVFGDEQIGILECLFRRLKPANCDILFEQV